MKRAGGAVILDPIRGGGAAAPRYRQIYADLRRAILAGRLKPGARLPSTRTLAGDLGVSRTTAEEAYGQLEAEGYLRRRTGDGTYVAPSLPEVPRGRPAAPPRRRGAPLALSKRGRALAGSGACVEPTAVRPFNAGLPPFDAFPVEAWTRLLARRMRHSGRELLRYCEPEGHPPLREAIASYLRTSRGVDCAPEQVLVLTSSLQALDLASRLLLDPGDTVCLEEPGYPGAAAVFGSAGARLVPVPVDHDGLQVDALRACRRARIVYVTPSNQYPTGAALSLERRLGLLAWAEACGAWIVEDDYDGEFRYVGRPIAAVHGLDRGGRVLYVGTFTKVMFPSIRVAYLVVPAELTGAFARARALQDGHTALLSQAALADFVDQGHFAAHLRRMRALCLERRAALLEAAAALPADRIRLGAADGGFRVVGWLERGADEAGLVRRAARAGLDLPALSRCYRGAPRPGLILGYTGLPPAAIRQAIRSLAAVVRGGGAPTR